MIAQDSSKEGLKSILKKSSQFDQDGKGETEAFPRVKSVKSIRFSLDLNRKSGNSQSAINATVGGKKKEGKKEGNKRQKDTNADPARGTRPMSRKRNILKKSGKNVGDGGDNWDVSTTQKGCEGLKEKEKKKKTWEECEEKCRKSSEEVEEKVLSGPKDENKKEMSEVSDVTRAEGVKEEQKGKDSCEEQSEKRESKKKRKRRRKRKRKSNSE